MIRSVTTLLLGLAALLVALAVLACAQVAPAQWAIQEGGTKARLRGVAAVGRDVAWASGTGGTVLRTTDGGQTWDRLSVPDSEGLDFRDVEARDADTAFVLS